MMLKLAILGLAATMQGGPPAQAACVAPAAPSGAERPAKPVLPPKPQCAETGSCMAGEADRYNAAISIYNAQVKTYGRDLQAYVDRLNAYVAAAGTYAKCEVEATNRP